MGQYDDEKSGVVQDHGIEPMEAIDMTDRKHSIVLKEAADLYGDYETAQSKHDHPTSLP